MSILFGIGILHNHILVVPDPIDKNSGYCFPKIVVKPTEGAMTEEGQIYDYRLTVVKKYQFIIWYWVCEIEIQNIITGKMEKDAQIFTEGQREELLEFVRAPFRFFLKHHMDILVFDGKKMKHETFLKHVGKWLKKK